MTESLPHPDGVDAKIICRSGDVKQMYTELPQQTLITAIKFCLDFLRSKTRRDRISIPSSKHDKTNCRLGHGFGDDVITFLFSDILNISIHDISNCFFAFAGIILHQQIGIPMGSQGSPPFAMCICMYYEYHCYQSIKDYRFFEPKIHAPHLTPVYNKLNACIRNNPNIGQFLDEHNITPDQLVSG
jgi:hypothetical protein